jgi:hypothetical protein
LVAYYNILTNSSILGIKNKTKNNILVDINICICLEEGKENKKIVFITTIKKKRLHDFGFILGLAPKDFDKIQVNMKGDNLQIQEKK